MLISFVFHPKHRSKSSAVRVVLIWLPVLERVCISLVSLFRRRVFDRRALFLSYNKNNGMSVILRIAALRISKFDCRKPSGSRITAD